MNFITNPLVTIYLQYFEFSFYNFTEFIASVGGCGVSLCSAWWRRGNFLTGNSGFVRDNWVEESRSGKSSHDWLYNYWRFFCLKNRLKKQFGIFQKLCANQETLLVKTLPILQTFLRISFQISSFTFRIYSIASRCVPLKWVSFTDNFKIRSW